MGGGVTIYIYIYIYMCVCVCVFLVFFETHFDPKVFGFKNKSTVGITHAN